MSFDELWLETGPFGFERLGTVEESEGFGTEGFEFGLAFEVAACFGFVQTEKVGVGAIEELRLREGVEECFEECLVWGYRLGWRLVRGCGLGLGLGLGLGEGRWDVVVGCERLEVLACEMRCFGEGGREASFDGGRCERFCHRVEVRTDVDAARWKKRMERGRVRMMARQCGALTDRERATCGGLGWEYCLAC